jgi:hypothetical protein
VLCSEAELKQRNARKLITLADNAGDNKNNVLFAFCCELIWRGWYDEIEMYFGPVGHTSNGNDSVHFVHNQIAGNANSVTLAEFLKAFYYAWSSDRTRPQPIILDTQYDWEEHYREHIQEASHFNRSRYNDKYCRAFRFQRSTDNRIEMMVKGSPANKDWCGLKGVANAPGLIILRSLPQDAPCVIPPRNSRLPDKDIAALKGLEKYCVKTDFGPSHTWLMKMAKTGQIPTNGPVPVDVQSKHHHQRGWGQVESIGVPGAEIHVPFIRPPSKVQTGREFWSLPPDLVAQPLHIHMPTTSHIECPPIDYRNAKKRKTKAQKQQEEDAAHEEEKKVESESDSDIDLPEHDDVAPRVIGEPTVWGANFSHCIPGSYAVIQTTYDEDRKTGISVIQVNNV